VKLFALQPGDSVLFREDAVGFAVEHIFDVTMTTAQFLDVVFGSHGSSKVG
jgi:hypothetical protein